MSQLPSPHEALEPPDLERFRYACAHERRSPMTMRNIDAATYGWIHLFVEGIQPEGALRPDWSGVSTADARKLQHYFERVAVRLRGNPGHDYARLLEAHFTEIADSLDPWPAL